MEDAPKKAGIRITDLLGKRWEDKPSFLEEPRMKWVALEARPMAGGGGCGRWAGGLDFMLQRHRLLLDDLQRKTWRCMRSDLWEAPPMPLKTVSLGTGGLDVKPQRQDLYESPWPSILATRGLT